MEVIMTYVQPFFDWFLQTTLIASVVICLILAAQKTLGGKLGPRWCHALWLVLVIRMVLPWAPSSRISLLNLVPSWDRQIQRQQLFETTEQHDVSQPAQTAGTSEAMPGQKPQSEIAIQERVALQPRTLADVQSETKPQLVSVRRVLPLLWLAGAMVIGAYLLVSDLALWRIVKRDCPLVNQSMLELFEECKAQMGVQSLVAVVPSSQVRSPALFGFIRPRLLLPREMLDTATREEMRYVFLHELAHLKRHDIYLGWLTSLLQVLHWFNPIIWFAFYRMRADRELACDALVLTRTGQEESQEYGRAIVGLLRRFSRSRPLPAMAGILETKSQLKRRITMIARFKTNSYQWSPLAVFLIILLACVSLPNARRTKASEISAEQSARQITLRQVWSGPFLLDLLGAPSPDGRYLSHVDWETGDLAISEIATGNKRRLTNKGPWDESDECADASRWSPDGKQIAYCWERGKDSVDLRVIGLDGSEPRTLYSTGEQTRWIEPCAWFPDGKQILVHLTGKDGTDQIVQISAADRSLRVLKTVGKDCLGYVRFSPDGQYIAYDSTQEEDPPNHDITVISTDGAREISLVKHPAHDSVLGWAPDGKSVLFASDRTGIWSIWLIAVADGKPQGAPELIKPDIGDFEPLGFTQKGSFYYGTSRGSNDIYIATLDPQTGRILASPEKATLRYEGSNITSAYSPDGKYLAYLCEPFSLTRQRSPRNILCIRSLETGKERHFTINLHLFSISIPRWSPDCRTLLVGGTDGENREGLFQIDAQTGDVKPLMLSEGDISAISYDWARDGKAIFYVHIDNDKLCRILVRDLESGTEKELYRSSSEFYNKISVSPDGKWLALRSQQHTDVSVRSLKVMSVTGEERRELYRFEKRQYLSSITWTADGGHILFASKVPGKNGWELCRIPAKGGQVQKLGPDMAWFSWINSLSVHPDGRHIAFQSSGPKRKFGEVWVMENFLPAVAAAKLDHQPNFRKIWIPTKPGNGVLSPDGERLAFVSEGSVWVVPVHGKVSPDIAGEPVRLTEPMGAWDVASLLAWSADGNWIAFNASNEKEDAIYVVRSSGSVPKKVPVEPHRRSLYNYRLSLSPDGKVLAFSSRYIEKSEAEPPEVPVGLSFGVRGFFIYTIPVAGGKVKRLTDSSSGEPAFSPDGKKIAFVKYYTSEKGELCGSLWVVPAAGGSPIRVSDSDPQRKVGGPIWSPDGKMIAFTSKALSEKALSERKEIYIVPVSETGKALASPTKIELPLGTYDMLAGWTLDNKIGVFLHNPDPWAIYTISTSGGKPVQVTTSGWTTHPQWSPDGERIYFRWGGGAIASVPSHGGELSIVRDHRDSTFSLVYPGSGNAVSPDGKELVFCDGGNIYTIPIDGGEPKQITRGRYPCWSPDGKSIAFIRYHRKSEGEFVWNIYIIPSKGGDVRKLTSESDDVRRKHIDWSPDGKLIAYFAKDKTIRIIPVQGGEPRIAATVEELRNHDELAWSPDGTKLVYSLKGSIWVVSSDGGEPEEIETGLDAKAGHVSWSPDGRKLAFTAIKGGEEELYLIENFLPNAVATSGN